MKENMDYQPTIGEYITGWIAGILLVAIAVGCFDALLIIGNQIWRTFPSWTK